jgi:hypothetical protein
LSEELVRRLLVCKYLLATSGGQLTPYSDSHAVARTILAAHDAAELAAAALAEHVGASTSTGQVYLMDYIAMLGKDRPVPVPGRSFFDQLNTVRRDFKHRGILPNVQSWHRAAEKTWGWVDEWCRSYLGIGLDKIDLQALLIDDNVRRLYREASEAHQNGDYPDALSCIASALHLLLRRVPRVYFPPRPELDVRQALMLTAYGVRPSDYLSLLSFLPEGRLDHRTDRLMTWWDLRTTGHPANWTESNVRFCLDTFLDLALKVQNAPPAPTAVPFDAVYWDVITPRAEFVDLWKPEGDPKRQSTGRTVVRRLRRGESLECRLRPSLLEKDASGVRRRPADSGPHYPVDYPGVIVEVWTNSPPDILYVERDDVEINVAPKEDPHVRAQYPHIFRGDVHPAGDDPVGAGTGS